MVERVLSWLSILEAVRQVRDLVAGQVIGFPHMAKQQVRSRGLPGRPTG
jgi:hypothetical protein